MHIIDYNELKQSLWENEVALTNASKSLREQSHQIDKDFAALERRRLENDANRTEVDTQLTSLRTKNK